MSELKINKNRNLKDPQYSFLGIKMIIEDIKTLPKWFKWMMLSGSVLVMFFNFFAISGYTPENIDPSYFEGIGRWFSPVQEYWKAMDVGTMLGARGDENLAMIATTFYSLNGVISITGLIAVCLIVYDKKSQFFWLLINATAYAPFALMMGYAGDFFLNIILAAIAIPGWYLITFKFKHNSIRNYSKTFKLSFWLTILLVAALSVFLWLMFIPQMVWLINPNYNYPLWSAKHIFDGLLCGVRLVGGGMQLVNFNEQFITWILVDAINFIKYAGAIEGIISVNMMIQFGVWFASSSIGMWERNLKETALPFFNKILKTKNN
ncbi:nicotinamide mononucleotide transporter PnuC [Williamsoniiplasma somnilux]|uniref:Nicotinamide mononucleotide transporter PnuC n=1 Tax=Williamsoniiplasma somnilux TaxID=215578 RepID=A0A2K8NX65_9MOLU|nr:nicotinamide mononucleotide transporter [Williamsoniiplasma somnilux]ATZ18409.1 nicotinamide mononucleotide transporter PnuC [Williamsoniiplasma somnilux]